MKSGIYFITIRKGKYVDMYLIVESTPEEFKVWMRSKELNVDFFRNSTLDGSSYGEEWTWKLKLALIQDLESKTETAIYKNVNEYNEFRKTFEVKLK